jgi:hypothetical protein
MLGPLANLIVKQFGFDIVKQVVSLIGDITAGDDSDDRKGESNEVQNSFVKDPCKVKGCPDYYSTRCRIH